MRTEQKVYAVRVNDPKAFKGQMGFDSRRLTLDQKVTNGYILDFFMDSRRIYDSNGSIEERIRRILSENAPHNIKHEQGKLAGYLNSGVESFYEMVKKGTVIIEEYNLPVCRKS